MKIAAFVPMRHHSVRVEGKNYRLINGKPLYHWIMEALLNVPEIDQVVVDTDSPVVIEGLAKDFPQVRNIRWLPASDHDVAQASRLLLFLFIIFLFPENAKHSICRSRVPPVRSFAGI